MDYVSNDGLWCLTPLSTIFQLLDLQLPVQSVPIITKVVSSNPRSWRGVLDTTLCDKVCHSLATGNGFL
jgi:hypothetical protein